MSLVLTVALSSATAWKGTLPVSDTYAIVVGAMPGKDPTKTLDVQITD